MTLMTYAVDQATAMAAEQFMFPDYTITPIDEAAYLRGC